MAPPTDDNKKDQPDIQDGTDAVNTKKRPRSQSCSAAVEASTNPHDHHSHPGTVEHHAGGAEALRLAGSQANTKRYDDEHGIVRQRTNVENVVLERESVAHKITEVLAKDEDDEDDFMETADGVSVAGEKSVDGSVVAESSAKKAKLSISKVPRVDLFLPEALKDAVFVGHLVTDLDSVAGAIGAAALYGGKAALASEINSETAFALEEWGFTVGEVGDDGKVKHNIPRVEDALKENPNAKVCLVDHQQTSQMNPAIPPDNVVGVIDHHALQSKTIVTDRPIYIDIRPWGSMSTIIAHTFLTHGRRPPTPHGKHTENVAGLLLSAILSDTLNLQGPTTTEWDRLMVAVLAEIAGVDDIQFLASQQFKAKSRELANLSAHGLVNGDQKSFSYSPTNSPNDKSVFEGEVGFAVVETTDDAVIIDRLDELLPEMVACKKEKGLSALFLAVVNIVDLKGSLLLCGPTEVSLAKAAFLQENKGEEEKKDDEPEHCPITHDGTIMDLGSRVSRKKDYIPQITRAIKQGWMKPLNRGASMIDVTKLGHLEVDPLDPYQRVVRVGSALESKKNGEENRKAPADGVACGEDVVKGEEKPIKIVA